MASRPSSALLMALFGWLLSIVFGPDENLLTTILSGALLGPLGLRPLKLRVGVLLGAGLGALVLVLDTRLESTLVAAAVTTAYPHGLGGRPGHRQCRTVRKDRDV